MRGITSAYTVSDTSTTSTPLTGPRARAARHQRTVW
jgi:hypothetical protein